MDQGNERAGSKHWLKGKMKNHLAAGRRDHLESTGKGVVSVAETDNLSGWKNKGGVGLRNQRRAGIAEPSLSTEKALAIISNYFSESTYGILPACLWLPWELSRSSQWTVITKLRHECSVDLITEELVAMYLLDQASVWDLNLQPFSFYYSGAFIGESRASRTNENFLAESEIVS